MDHLKINRVTLVGGQKSTTQKTYFAKLVKFLRGQKKEVLLDKSIAKILGRKAASSPQIKNSDLILVFGGDGALLGAVRDYFDSSAKFAGVRLDGTLGFLTEYSPKDLTKLLAQFFRKKFEVDERILIKAKVRRGGKIIKTLRALNEVVVQQNAFTELIELDFDLDGKRIATFHADGAILATPTGSTAYSLSAGGPILDPNLKAFILTPINPHLLTARPLVLQETGKLHSKIRAKNLFLVADGQKSFGLKIGDEIIFEKCEWILQTIHPKNRNHFETLRKKLNWSERKV
jgi:NAD+ kinase